MKNIYVAATNKPSRLYLVKDKLKLSPLKFTNDEEVGWLTQNIYITSDEEIREGTWCLGKENYLTKNWNALEGFEEDYKKIILTTDTDLIKDGVQAIDDEFLQWIVKNPSCEEVEINSVIILKESRDETDYPEFDYYNYEIIIPKEEPKQIKCYCGHTITCDCGELELECKDCNKSLENCTCIEDTIDMKQETLEEASKNPINYTKETNGYPKIQAFIDGAKWQINKQDEFTLGFLHWYNTSEECERYLRRNYPKNITMNGEHYKKVLEINKELLEMYKNTLPHGTVAERFNKT